MSKSKTNSNIEKKSPLWVSRELKQRYKKLLTQQGLKMGYVNEQIVKDKIAELEQQKSL